MNFFDYILLSLILLLTQNVEIQSSFNDKMLLEKFIKSVPESALDGNRSILFEDVQIFIPKKIPKLTKLQKFQLIQKQLNKTKLENGTNIAVIMKEFNEKFKLLIDEKNNSSKVMEKKEKIRRALDYAKQSLKPFHIFDRKKWITQIKSVKRNILSTTPQKCPQRFDAVTQAVNKRTYMFAGEFVYEIYQIDGLRQKSVYQINDVFPGGPRQVNAAFTNRKSGVTMLIGYKTIFRYVWSKRFKQFNKANKMWCYDLPSEVDFVPTLAFQWKDGNLILANEQFVSFYPYWNMVLFSAKVKDYFPNIPKNTIGIVFVDGIKNKAKIDSSILLLMTDNSELQVYDLNKSKIVQKYPISVNKYMACISKSNQN